MKKLRQSAAESIFGSLTHCYGPRKKDIPGKAGAYKAMLMAILDYDSLIALRCSTPHSVRLLIVCNVLPCSVSSY